LNAIAFKVVVPVTATGPVYGVEDSVGVVPSVVYRMVTPGEEVIRLGVGPTVRWG
jgi:hypothetical protein